MAGETDSKIKKYIKPINYDKEREEKIIKYVKLVDEIRNTKKPEEIEKAFNEIVKMMDSKIKQISYNMRIPGCLQDDLYQEALYALRYKAIKDYDKSRSDRTEISPFDNFALLCIRRHLSTKLKSSFQSKNIVINQALSIDQDRSVSGSENESVNLSDIIPSNDIDASSMFEKSEGYNLLVKSLWGKMSILEQKVFLLYKQNMSYEEIARKVYDKKKITKADTKSVDNALSRIKMKARWVYERRTSD